jgi:hypothetical protein
VSSDLSPTRLAKRLPVEEPAYSRPHGSKREQQKQKQHAEVERQEFMKKVDSELLWTEDSPQERQQQQKQHRPGSSSPSSSSRAKWDDGGPRAPSSDVVIHQTNVGGTRPAQAVRHDDESDREYLTDMLSEFMRRQQADLRNLHVEIVRQTFVQKVSGDHHHQLCFLMNLG